MDHQENRERRVTGACLAPRELEVLKEIRVSMVSLVPSAHQDLLGYRVPLVLKDLKAPLVSLVPKVN